MFAVQVGQFSIGRVGQFSAGANTSVLWQSRSAAYHLRKVADSPEVSGVKRSIATPLLPSAVMVPSGRESSAAYGG